MSSDLTLPEIRKKLNEMMAEASSIEKEQAKEKPEKRSKKGNLQYKINDKDWRNFKADLNSMDTHCKLVMERINGISQLAAMHPEEMDSLPISEYTQLNTMRMEAMMFDTAMILKLIALYNFRQTGEQALACSYTIQQLQQQVTYLQRMIDEIADKVDVDLSSIKEKMNVLKTTLDSQEVSLISTFVKDTNKKIAEYKKKMAENDLAT